jgi:hypothetical protein
MKVSMQFTAECNKSDDIAKRYNETVSVIYDLIRETDCDEFKEFLTEIHDKMCEVDVRRIDWY